MTDQTRAYTPLARALHWITAVLVIGMIPSGIIMANLENSPLANTLYDLHRSTGLLLLPIVALRLAMRFSHPPGPLPEHLAPLQRLAAHATHWGLYVLLVVQPLLGWAATSAYRAPITFFWLFRMPPILPENRPLSEQLFAAHRALGLVIAALAVAHIGAALYHYFIERDDVLARMIPRLAQRREALVRRSV